MAKSGWTVETLRQFVIALREADQLAVQTALSAADKRLDGMNEFRATINDQIRTYLPRVEFDSHVQGQAQRLQEQITAIQKDVIRLAAEGSSNGSGLGSVGEKIGLLDQKLSAQLPREVYEQQHSALQTRVEKLETWRASVAGRTVVIVAIVGLLSGTFGIILGHVLFK